MKAALETTVPAQLDPVAARLIAEILAFVTVQDEEFRKLQEAATVDARSRREQ